MSRIKSYKEFNEGIFSGFSKKKPKRMNAKEFIEWVIQNYKSFEDKKEYYFFNISSNFGLSVSYNDANDDYHVIIEEKSGKYYLVDFKDKDGNLGKMNPETHKYETYPTEISKEDYDKYVKEINSIDDYLDEKDEKKHIDNTPSISADGELLNVKSSPLEETNYKISEALKKYINKSFTFDTDYIIWTSDSTNNSRDKEIEETQMKIKEFKIDFYRRLDDEEKPRMFGEIIADWSVNGKEYSIMIEDDYTPEWVDLDKSIKSYKEVLTPHETEERTRREDKKFWKSKDKYPMPYLFKMSPSKYDTIEMLNDFINIIKMINDSLNN